MKSGTCTNAKEGFVKTVENQNHNEIAEQCCGPTGSAASSPVHHRVHPKRKTKTKDESNDPELNVQQHIRIHGKAKRNQKNGNTITKERSWLNSNRFGYYLEHVWNSFPEEKLQSMTYLDPLMFYSYTNGYSNVINDIKNERLFSKKYVLVPIVLWSHWNLLIFCHLGESLDSTTCTPCMLLLDSLHNYGAPTKVEPIIKRLLCDIYKSEERHETKEQLERMPLLVPEVPQQKNGSACGFYVLYYINLFLNNAPENFNIFSGYPYFMKQDWFTAEEVESFCQKLDALPPDLNDATSPSYEDEIEFLGTKKEGKKTLLTEVESFSQKRDALPLAANDATSHSSEDEIEFLGTKKEGKKTLLTEVESFSQKRDALPPASDDATSYSSDDEIEFLGTKKEGKKTLLTEVESFCKKRDAFPPDSDDATSCSSEDGIEFLGTKKDGTKFP